MNLTSIFKKDAALVDLAWTRDGIVHTGEPQLDISGVKNPNNVKPQLEMEWGLGGPNVDLDEPAGAVKRNLPEDAEGDAGPVVMFARDMMNRGFSLAKVATELRKKYGSSIPKSAKAGLADLFRMDGIIGRVAIDGRGYASCKDAIKAASTSPYKRFVRYVLGCECGEPHMMPAGGSEGLQMADSTGNPMDDFLGASDVAKSASKVAHCRSTMLPLLGSELDPSYMDDTLVEMMNVAGLPQTVVDRVSAMKASNLAKVAAAFRWMDRNAAAVEAGRYSEAAGNAEFRLKRADVPLDVGTQAEAQMEDVWMGEVPAEVVVEPGLEEQDVEMGQFMEPEFEGGDEVGLDDVAVPEGQIDLEMAPMADDELEFLADEGK